jgi:hypothetical protein
MTAGYYNFNYDSRLESLEWQYHISALSGPGLHSASFILVLLNYPKKREPEPPFKGKYYYFLSDSIIILKIISSSSSSSWAYDFNRFETGNARTRIMS